MTSRRDLKDDELTAQQYLLGLGVGSVTFEPDGNIPPDFVINNRIAIEVRRIEDQYWGGAKPQGLRTVQKNIEKTVRSSLSALGSMHPTDSWFVHYNFNRPLPDWRWLQAEIQETLRLFVINPDEGNTWRLHPSFRIRIWRAAKKHTQTFLLGGNIDRDQTAFVSQAVSASLRHAIEEKTQKSERLSVALQLLVATLSQSSSCGGSEF